jgi:hypothetical protein
VNNLKFASCGTSTFSGINFFTPCRPPVNYQALLRDFDQRSAELSLLVAKLKSNLEYIVIQSTLIKYSLERIRLTS